MKCLRETIIEQGPFEKFYIECYKCGDVLFTTDDYERGKHMRNEVLLGHRIEEHVALTGHTEVGGQLDPLHKIKTLETTITVNNNS